MLAKGSPFSRLLYKWWVSSQHVPLQVISELELDLSNPIIYVVEHNSASDLLGLQRSCLKAGLPDPYLPVQVGGQSLSAIIYIEDWSLFAKRFQPQSAEAPYLRQYQQLLDLYKLDENLDIQLVPVTFYWGRNPGKQGKTSWFDLLDLRRVGALHKFMVVLKNGRDHLVRFNPPVSIAALYQRDKSVQQLAHKLAKVAVSFFAQQKRSSVGPKLVSRKEMIDAVLQQESLQKVIKEQAESGRLTNAQLESRCRAYLQEISADFSYPFLKVFRKLLSWVWNHIYQGVEVHHAQAVRQACQSGAEILYMPCHRSHMDYLLLSYLLFEQGLVPPHVAAGVNLNFFPAGPVFRRCGAFFLRRTFKNSPLYAAVFKAYFAMLFQYGYPIEFFSEGGRSRTGRLLPPKTGLLALSLQTYLNQTQRNLVIIPVYIGYDHIMEVATYSKELTGQKKKQESLWQVLGIVKKLGNFGRAFVNFGEPISIKHCFTPDVANCQQAEVDPQQFKEQVLQVAHKVMVAINAATAVNALPLCAAILLASKEFSVAKPLFFRHICKHQQLLALLKENSLLTYAQGSAETIYRQALALNKFVERDGLVGCSPAQARHLTYYRNNIVHLFVLPALLCSSVRYLLWQNKALTCENIIFYAAKVYPFLQAEYFLDNQQSMKILMQAGLAQLEKIDVLRMENGLYRVSDDLLSTLMAGHLRETFLRYHQLLSLLFRTAESWPQVDEEELVLLCKEKLQGRSIELFDDKEIKVFLQTLQQLYPDFISKEQGKTLLDLFYHSF